MNRLIQLSALLSLLLTPCCSKPKILSPKEFSAEFASALKTADVNLRVEIVAELELKVTPKNGSPRTAFLNNAYDVYKQEPEAREDVIQRFVTASLEIPDETAFDRTRVVPIVKDRRWIDEVRQASRKADGSKPLSLVVEDLNEELVVIYALDSPKNIRYISPEDLKKDGLQAAQLRSLACDNLRRLIPELQRHGENSFYLFTADGSYEASLILFDKLWADPSLEVDGELVVAIPSRDFLMVTGSKNASGLARMRQTVAKIVSEAPYRLTNKLFVRRNDKFEIWGE